MLTKSLLIVDDALVIRQRIRNIAEKAGWLIAGEAENGEDAVQQFCRLRPDLVTLDIVMPKVDGAQTLRRIRELAPDAKVVMVSAVNQRQKLAECIGLGAIDFIVKPFDAAELSSFFKKQLLADDLA
jgi:two-component system chemotaxis response regulator CheY